MLFAARLLPAGGPSGVFPAGGTAAHAGHGADGEDITERFIAELPGLHGFVERMGVPAVDGDDLIQEVFLIFHRRRRQYDASRPLGPWLRGIAYRLTLNRRKPQREQPHDDVHINRGAATTADPESRAATNEGLGIVRAALDGLPVKLRAVFVMHEIEGLDMREVARALSIPRFTAYSRLRLAREKFATVARKHLGDSP